MALAQGTMVCGVEVYPSPTGFPAMNLAQVAQAGAGTSPTLSGDPCIDGEAVLGPLRFERGKGRPDLVINEFALEAEAAVCVVAEASALQGDSEGKAIVYNDGAKIAEPEDFDDRLEEQVIHLAAGDHGLGVRVVGSPAGFVDVTVLQVANGGGGDDDDPDLPMPGEIRIDAATGALDMVSSDGAVRLQNVATDHPLLTLNGDGHHDTTMLQALTTPLNELPGKDDGSVAYFLDWEFQLVDLDTCSPILGLSLARPDS
jgi:hypothetical protein